MGSFSLIHWVIVAVVVLLLFGPKRLPEVAKGLGQSIKDFKKALDDDKKDTTAQRQIPHDHPTDKHDHNHKV